MEESQRKIIDTLNREGGIVVMPTDTIYGLIARAFDKTAVEKIYTLKKRTPCKPLIVLIAAISDLEKFSITLTEKDKEVLAKIWPGPFSVQFSFSNEHFLYISADNTLAIRLPDNPILQDIIRQTGPLVAPSANIEGMPPATTAEEAQKYFGAEVDLYVGSGESVEGEPSTLVSLKNGAVQILRQGRGVLRGG